MKPGKSARSITYPALLGAMSIVLLYGSSVLPTGTVGLVALAGVPCAGVVIAGGTSAGLLCWAAVSMLGFFLIPDKACVLMYAAMFGLYPVVKSLAESLRRKGPEMICKLVFFNLSLTAVIWIAKLAILSGLPWDGIPIWGLYVVSNLLFLAYDYGFSGLIAAYLSRMGKRKTQ